LTADANFHEAAVKEADPTEKPAIIRAVAELFRWRKS
jgi:hypothetical protein